MWRSLLAIVLVVGTFTPIVAKGYTVPVALNFYNPNPVDVEVSFGWNNVATEEKVNVWMIAPVPALGNLTYKFPVDEPYGLQWEIKVGDGEVIYSPRMEAANDTWWSIEDPSGNSEKYPQWHYVDRAPGQGVIVDDNRGFPFALNVSLVYSEHIVDTLRLWNNRITFDIQNGIYLSLNRFQGDSAYDLYIPFFPPSLQPQSLRTGYVTINEYLMFLFDGWSYEKQY